MTDYAKIVDGRIAEIWRGQRPPKNARGQIVELPDGPIPADIGMRFENGAVLSATLAPPTAQEVKNECRLRILLRYPAETQMSLMANGGIARQAMTEWIAAMRDCSRRIRAMEPIPHDFREDRYWKVALPDQIYLTPPANETAESIVAPVATTLPMVVQPAVQPLTVPASTDLTPAEPTNDQFIPGIQELHNQVRDAKRSTQALSQDVADLKRKLAEALARPSNVDEAHSYATTHVGGDVPLDVLERIAGLETAITEHADVVGATFSALTAAQGEIGKLKQRVAAVEDAQQRIARDIFADVTHQMASAIEAVAAQRRAG